jgi:predicted HAD superfamily Cof-like phosphohydrolase
VREEYEEVMREFAYLSHAHTPDEVVEGLRRLLKELADLRYVVEGAAVSFGLPFEEAFSEVHRSNMSKLGPDGQPMYREDGKVLKGPGYFEADMTRFVPSIIDHREDPSS